MCQCDHCDCLLVRPLPFAQYSFRAARMLAALLSLFLSPDSHLSKSKIRVHTFRMDDPCLRFTQGTASVATGRGVATKSDAGRRPRDLGRFGNWPATILLRIANWTLVEKSRKFKEMKQMKGEKERQNFSRSRGGWWTQVSKTLV